MELALDTLQSAFHVALRAGYARDASLSSGLDDLFLVRKRLAALARKGDTSGSRRAIYDVIFEGLEALA